MMPELLGNTSLIEALSETGFIKNGKRDNIDGIKYDFCLSTEILKAKFKQPINIASLPDTMKRELVVEPGEVVFVLTQETLVLPNNIMAILIPKRKLSHDGIMILGGLSVDPLYEGRLLIGLYNLSSTQYPIIPGKKLIGSHFYKLNANEVENSQNTLPVKIHDFPDELIRLMQSYKPVSTEALMTNVSNLETKFEALLQEFRTKDDWFERLQESMDRHEKNVDKILQSLEKEIDDRRTSDSLIETKVDSVKGDMKEYMKSAYKTAGMLGGIGAVIAVLVSLAFYFVQRMDDQTKSNSNSLPQSITIPVEQAPQNKSVKTDTVPAKK